MLIVTSQIFPTSGIPESPQYEERFRKPNQLLLCPLLQEYLDNHSRRRPALEQLDLHHRQASYSTVS
ncbi:hypothetical protein BC936DRAFT_139719 [Jimgerdemannia flammicorona]|uniref:Uncharacterized protein n=1 Tax=Jimgerdemannia flammicorona TaxID=994334 RepID=A0A433DHF6_9FUNG|nr:hypothetical protein BC936DRAFT_139719 [Jimgerdemannia flammicorona]